MLLTTNKDNYIDWLGCTPSQFRKWLKYQFEEEWTFDNYAEKWTLDHVIPCKNFDLTIDEEYNKCFHWSNVQPIDKIENLSKNKRTTIEEQVAHQEKIDDFISKNEDYETIDFDRTDYG